MHLSPRDLDKLLLHNAGFLAQKRLARGLSLNYPESIALIAAQILELIRDGKTVADLMNTGRQMLGRRQVQPGIPQMIREVQVEGTFPDGTKLVTIHHPISLEDGDLQLALYGSFLPIPDLELFEPPVGFAVRTSASEIIPGEISVTPGEIILNQSREATPLQV